MDLFNHQLEIFIPPSNDHDVIVTPLTTWQVVNCVVSIGESLANASYTHEATCIIPKLGTEKDLVFFCFRDPMFLFPSWDM